MIVWINGTHGVGKTTTAALVQRLLPGSRVFDAEKLGEALMAIEPGLPATDDFQHWPPWRPMVVESARRIHAYTGGPLIMPMTVLVEAYWQEIATGLAEHDVPIVHVVLHADPATLRARIRADTVMGTSTFRLARVDAYAAAARAWLHRAAEVVDTTTRSPADAAAEIAARGGR